MSKKIRHRGPDWSGIYCGKTAILCHERLSIVDPQSGGQPLFSPDRKQILAVNGKSTTTAKSVNSMPDDTTSKRAATARSSSRSTKTKASIS